ncbi:MAG TPA: hypothetical protein VFO77_13635, partial [Actinoplanes sp.]|nr:hypothetical protein [Actinoplanes sp.]
MNAAADPSASSPEPGPGSSPAHPSAGWAQQPEAPQPAKARRWWLVGLIAGWAVLLVIVSVISVRRDRPTV